MYNCKKCLENVWSFNFIDGWIEATCKICGNVISFESKKTKYKRINNQLPKAKFPVLYIDGGCTLPGQLDPLKREIISVVTNEKGTVVSEYNGKVVGGGSANIAEFNALFNALFFIKTKNWKEVSIFTDSRNNISWFKRKWSRIKKDKIKHLNNPNYTSWLGIEIEATKMVLNIELIWIPREINLAGYYIEKKYSL